MLLGMLSLPNSTLNHWTEDPSQLDIVAYSTSPWPGATEWYNRPNFNPHPCYSSFYSNFSAAGATMAVYETKVSTCYDTPLFCSLLSVLCHIPLSIHGILHGRPHLLKFWAGIR